MNDELGNQWTRVRDYAEDKVASASEQVKDIGAKARENAAAALETTRERAGELAGQAKVRGAQLVQDNPLAVVAGGLVLGAIIGALLPKRKGGIGSTLATGLVAAKGISAAASGELAKAAGKAKERIGEIDTAAARARLSELADTGRAKASEVIEKANDALSSAADRLKRK